LRWNAGPPEEGLKKTQGEVEFFHDLIDHLSQTYSIDQDRIYVNGMSNGGGMTHLLACQLTDRIAAFGGVAGAYLYQGDYCQPQNPAPWIAFHGEDDPVVPYQGGSTRDGQGVIQFTAVESWIAEWAEYNRCDPSPEKGKITPEITRFTYGDCDQDVTVVLYKIAGAGHTWPGGGRLPVWLTGKTNQDVNATRLMWEFFQKYSLD
jgi:polyhydroxybutyrate depolymerase